MGARCKCCQAGIPVQKAPKQILAVNPYVCRMDLLRNVHFEREGQRCRCYYNREPDQCVETPEIKRHSSVSRNYQAPVERKSSYATKRKKEVRGKAKKRSSPKAERISTEESSTTGSIVEKKKDHKIHKSTRKETAKNKKVKQKETRCESDETTTADSVPHREKNKSNGKSSNFWGGKQKKGKSPKVKKLSPQNRCEEDISSTDASSQQPLIKRESLRRSNDFKNHCPHENENNTKRRLSVRETSPLYCKRDEKYAEMRKKLFINRCCNKLLASPCMSFEDTSTAECDNSIPCAAARYPNKSVCDCVKCSRCPNSCSWHIDSDCFPKQSGRQSESMYQEQKSHDACPKPKAKQEKISIRKELTCLTKELRALVSELRAQRCDKNQKNNGRKSNNKMVDEGEMSSDITAPKHHIHNHRISPHSPCRE